MIIRPRTHARQLCGYAAAAGQAGPGEAPSVAADGYDGAARVFERGGDGAFSETTKISFDRPDSVTASVGPDGQPRLSFISQESSFVRIRQDGSVDFTFQADGRLGEVLHEPRSQRYFLRTGTSLYSLDAKTGEPKGQFKFDDFGYGRRFCIDREGQVILADDKQLVVLDRDLKPKHRQTSSFDIDTLLKLKDGTVLAHGGIVDSDLAIVEANGELNTIGKDVVERTITQGPRGHIWFVEGSIRGGQRLTVAAHDPVSRHTERFKATEDTGKLIPFTDGRVLAYDDDLAKPGLVLYSREGNPQKRIRLGEEQFLRQFYLANDQKTAWAVLDHYPDDGPTERSLVKVDLSPPNGVGGFFGDLAASVGMSEAAELVYKTFDEPIIPAVLENGEALIFKKKGIDHLDPQGKVIGSFAGADELLQQMPAPATATEGITLDHTVKSTVAGGFKNFLEAATQRFGYPGALEHETGIEGWSLSERDNTLNHRRELPGQDAITKMGLEDESEYQKLLSSNTLFNTTISDRVVPFPQLTGAKVEVGSHRIRAWLPQGDEMVSRELSVSEPTFYTTALPLTIDQRPFLLAASSDGLVALHDLSQNSREVPTYNVGRVQGMMAKNDRVYTIGENAEVMVLRFPGKELLAPDQLQLQGKGGEVDFENLENAVVIGDIELDINF